MKKIVKLLAFFVFITLLFSCISGCSLLRNDPPTISEIQEVFDRDKEYLLLITDYLINADYSKIFILEDCETANADLEVILIDDATAVSAFKQLKNRGYTSFSKSGNTIRFGIWTKFNDTGCGIAYSIDGKEISVQYMTESAPLLEDGWYYYVSDFNEWRSRQHETE